MEAVAGPMGLCVYKGGDHVSGLLPYLAILVGGTVTQDTGATGL